jgi:formin-binding protein 1
MFTFYHITSYPYDAAPDEVGGTTISMREGDELLLLERDVGDGWTRVRHQRSGHEGFVPTSYLVSYWITTDHSSSC